METLTIAAERLYEPDAGLLAVATFSLVVWYGLLGVLALIRWPKSPAPGPPTHDLRPESPAVANLLSNGWLLSEDAMPATLLDLSARGFVIIEDRGDGQMQCRLKKTTPGRSQLQDYEARVLDHIERRATGGVVPAAALTTGPEEQSSRWWKSFRKDVGTDAKARGVARDFWPARLSAVMVALGVPIYLLVESAQGWNDPSDVHMTPLLAIVTYTMYGALIPLGVLTGTSRLRETPEGRVAAAHWLGVREDLETLPSFRDLPPTAVATWERHLAYGAALGVAGRSVKSLPLGAEHDRRAWTNYGGTWKQVVVQYPKFRPGWGMHPALAVLLGLFRVGVAVAVLWAAVSFDLFRMTTYGSDVPWWGSLIAIAIFFMLVGFLAWSFVGLVWAAMDLPSPPVVEGEVLRTRERSFFSDESKKKYFVAVYQGSGDSIRAWRVAGKKYSWFYQGQDVKIRVTPRLGYIVIPE